MATANGKMIRASLRKNLLYAATALCLLMAVIFIVNSAVSGTSVPGVFIALAVLFVVAAAMTFVRAKRMNKMILLYRQYISIMNQYPDGRIDELAKHTAKSEAETMENLTYMINQNWFVNAFINRDTQCLVITRTNPENNINADKNEYISCTCPACGGVSKVLRGKSSKCDFCGGTIHG